MTVNALQPSVKFVRQQKYTQNDLMIDPLIVLRCDQRVYRYVSFEFVFTIELCFGESKEIEEIQFKLISLCSCR